MKINGRVVNKPNSVLLVLPREDGDLAFKFDAIVDDSEFHQLCPRPQPPKKTKKGGVVVEDTADPDFVATLSAWAEKKMAWSFLKSIGATEGLEWTTVKMDDSESWRNWDKDLKAAGFSISEIRLLEANFLDANSLSEERLKEARDRFLLQQQAASSPA